MKKKDTDELTTYVPKDKSEKIKKLAKSAGMSVSQFLLSKALLGETFEEIDSSLETIQTDSNLEISPPVPSDFDEYLKRQVEVEKLAFERANYLQRFWKVKTTSVHTAEKLVKVFFWRNLENTESDLKAGIPKFYVLYNPSYDGEKTVFEDRLPINEKYE